MARPAILYGDGFLDYNFGKDHAFQEIRVKLAYELMAAYGFFRGPADLVAPRPAAEEDVLRLHERRYVEAVKDLGEHPREEAYEFGLGPGDNPIFKGMYAASALQVGATIQALECVVTGERPRAYTLGGGLHHAMAGRASGFCIFNDVAIGFLRLLEGGRAKRILYVDVDAHHGDGVQAAFYGDPRVLTVSLHEDGRFLFPGTGFPEDLGEGEGKGYSVNVPLPPYTRDASYLHAFEEVVPPLARAFRPDVILTQTGADGYYMDPLAHLKLTTRTYERVAHVIDGLANELCGGRWVSATGGGYDMMACARVWTLIASVLVGIEVGDEIPPEWREASRWEIGSVPAPRHLRDTQEPAEKASVSEAVRETVAKVKAKVFPLHGL